MSVPFPGRTRCTVGPLGLLALGCLVLTSVPVCADTVSADPVAATDTAAVEQSAPVNLWVKDARLSVLVQQLAELTGREADVEEGLDMRVSGRFNGKLEQTLAILATEYPVLFDLDEDVLRAAGKDSGSSISIALLSDELSEPFKRALFDQIAPGNDVEIRSDAVRVTGHPLFVKRTTAMITRTLADNGARQIIEQKASTSTESIATGISESVDDDDAAITTAVIDSGSAEMLADIADEGRPPSDQATLSQPIRWVTDIPGFDTF